MKYIKMMICFVVAASIITLTSTSTYAIDKETESIVRYLEIMTGDDQGKMNFDKLVTRAEFSKMLVMASTYKDTVNTNGYTSVFPDVSYEHWAAGYIKTALDLGWVTGYIDGHFYPNQPVKLEEAATMVLRVIGYDQKTLLGVYPQAQINQYQSLELNRGIHKTVGEHLTREDCAVLLTNLLETKTYEGTYYGNVLGYVLDSDYKLDYDLLIEKELIGPLVVYNDAWYTELPFKVYNAHFYKGGNPVTSKEIYVHDVYYYNPYSREVWAYSDKILGKITDITSSLDTAKAISINGVSYPVTLEEVIQTLEKNSEFKVGDQVALLLGSNQTVVDIVPLDEVDGFRKGYVTNISVTTFKKTDGTSMLAKIVTVAEMDGKTHDYIYEGKETFVVGSLVDITVSSGKIKVEVADQYNRSGLFSLSNMKLGQYDLATDVRIMDTNGTGGFEVINPQRLDNVRLYSSDVYSVYFNDQDEIDTIFLRGVTGDLLDYGYLTNITENYTLVQDIEGNYNEVLTSKTYNFYLNGIERSTTVEPDKWDVYIGGIYVTYDSDKLINNIVNISILSVEATTQTKIQSGGKTYLLSDGVEAYYYNKGEYYKVDVSSIMDLNQYDLTGYYDRGSKVTGLIRVLIARDKNNN